MARVADRVPPARAARGDVPGRPFVAPRTRDDARATDPRPRPPHARGVPRDDRTYTSVRAGRGRRAGRATLRSLCEAPECPWGDTDAGAGGTAVVGRSAPQSLQGIVVGAAVC